MSGPARTAGTVAFFAAIPLLLAPGLLWGEVWWLRDVWQYHWPMRDCVAEQLAAGRWPLWTSHVAAGVPLGGNPAVGAWYPLNPIVAWLPSGLGLTWLMAAHFVLAGLGARALARAHGATGAGGWLAGVAYATAGPVVSHVSTVTHLMAAAWIPIALLAARRWCEGRDARWCAAAAAALALQVLAGAPQLALYTGLAMGLTVACDPPQGVGSWSARGKLVGTRLGPVALLAAALAAVQIVPAAEWLGQVTTWSAAGAGPGDGREFAWAHATASSWSPGRLLLEQLAPGVVGTPSRTNWYLGLDWSAPYVGRIWIGAVPILLAILAGGARRTGGRGPLAWAVMGLWLTLGAYGGLYLLLWYGLPGFSSFRYPDKALPFLAIGVAVLAGRGATRWLAERPAGAFDRRDVALWSLAGGWILAAVWIGTVLAAALQPQVPVGQESAAALDWTLACLAGGCAALLAGLACTVARPGRLRGGPAWLGGALLVGLALGEGVLVNGAVADTQPRAAFVGPLAPLPELTERDADTWRWHAVREPPPRVADLDLVFADVAARHRRARGRQAYYGPVLEGRSTLAAYETSPTRVYADLIGGTNSIPWLGALAATHIYSELELADPALTPLGSGDGLWVYRIEPALPRARLVGAAEPVADVAAARARLTDVGFPHAERVCLFADDLPAAGLTGESPTAAAAGTATITADLGSRVVVRTDAAAPTLCLLADVWYPGWTATVDGQPAPVLRANGGFRAVPVPAGSHEVVMELRSTTAAVGFWITLLAALVAIGWPTWSRRRVG